VAKRRDIIERKRRDEVDALRENLADLRGYSVGRVSFRQGTLIIWLRFRHESEPAVAIRLSGLRAFRDNGIGGCRLTRGSIVEKGLLGLSCVRSDDDSKPEGLQLDLWTAQNPDYPSFQAFARSIRMLSGRNLSPERAWSK
jgi:hypothetical protein